MLKFQTNEVPTGLEQYYEDAGDGSFRLKVEGAVPAAEVETHKAKLKEFRDTNITLKKQVDELGRFEQMFKSGEFSSEKLNAKIEEQALQKAAEMKAAYEASIAELNTKLGSTSTQLERVVVTNAVSAAALKHGVQETALDDVLARAASTFTAVDGQVAAKDGVLDAKGNKLTVDAWMASLAEKAPHLFTASRGAGAQKTGKPTIVGDKKSPVDLISAGLAKRR
jgi:hypothetical protein